MYIKLYEQWLNEAEVAKSNFSTVISRAMDGNNKKVDNYLNQLSQYGTFSNEIREAIKLNKAKYSDSLWSNIGTMSGVENAINTFKMMFTQMIKGKDISTYRSKFEQAMSDALRTTGSFQFDDKIMNSSKVVDLMNTIAKGNKKYADEIGFYFAMFDVACAVTNGLYYISSQLPLDMKGNYVQEDSAVFKNVKELADYKLNRTKIYDDIINKAEGQFEKAYSSSRVGYMSVGSSGFGRTLSYSIPTTDYVLQVEKFVDYVNNFSVSNFQREAQSSVNEYPFWYFPQYAFGVLYIGHYYNSIAMSILERSITFMEQGGATWYQKLLG